MPFANRLISKSEHRHNNPPLFRQPVSSCKWRRRVAAVLAAWGAAFLVLGVAQAAAGTDSLEGRLPPGGFRDVAWKDPCPGKWQVVDVTQKGIAPDGGDVTARLQALVDSLSGLTVLSFPPGTYHFSKITIHKSNLILRGAGPKQTMIHASKDGMVFCWWGSGGRYEYAKLGAEFQPRQVTADVAPGGTSVSVADAGNLRAGDMVLVEEDLDKWSYPDARRGRGGVFLIAKAEGPRLTLDLPLAIGLSDVRADKKHAIVAKLDPVRNVGLEGFRIVLPDQPGDQASALFLKRVSNAYIRNVEVYNPSRHHVEICYSRQVVVEDCFFDEAKEKGGGGYGYGVCLRDLSTLCKAENNIFRDLRHAMATEVGVSYCVFAYNLDVDRVRDLAHSPHAPPQCREEKWINDKRRNGITNAFLTSDVAAHGNFPHHVLFEGNLFYIACVDRSHETNGPHFFFRNCALGQPPKYGWWQEGAGIAIMGPNDNQVVVGNDLRNDAVILLQKHEDSRTSLGSLIAGNVLRGKVDWGPLPPDTKLPASLYLKDRPRYWPQELAWPAFGPDAAGSAAAKIPAQLRYERQR
jgi:uncharacterized protein YodC (DUF2158 family)